MWGHQPIVVKVCSSSGWSILWEWNASILVSKDLNIISDTWSDTLYEQVVSFRTNVLNMWMHLHLNRYRSLAGVTACIEQKQYCREFRSWRVEVNIGEKCASSVVDEGTASWACPLTLSPWPPPCRRRGRAPSNRSGVPVRDRTVNSWYGKKQHQQQKTHTSLYTIL